MPGKAQYERNDAMAMLKILMGDVVHEHPTQPDA